VCVPCLFLVDSELRFAYIGIYIAVKKFLFLVLIILLPSAGFIFGRYIFPQKSSPVQKVSLHNGVTEIRSSDYKFISPLLECEFGAGEGVIVGLNPLQKSMARFIEQQKKNGLITSASVYLRDLNNGPWIGLNEHEPFSPASLLKLPLMMAYYKKAEKDPDLLKRKLKYEKADQLLSQSFVPKEKIEKGKEYAVEELLERMMVFSDNAALTVLQDHIEASTIDKITLDLGVETATLATPEDFMSVKGYAGLFRILYNSSYLEKESSEKILSVLSQTKFDQGLVAGVPRSINVSHKFGERELPNGTKQLHDCGIVYFPKKPYLLCVMTKGTDFVNLERFIAGISSMAYHGIESR